MASTFRPTLTNTELVDIFMGILQSLYYEKMVGSLYSNFDDIVIIGERIESKLKTGKIAGGGSQPSASRIPSGEYTKKKEGETNEITTIILEYEVPVVPSPYYPYSYVATT